MKNIINILILTVTAQTCLAQSKQVQIPLELLDRLEQVAEQKQKPINDIVEIAIRNYLDKHPILVETIETDNSALKLDPATLSTSLILEDGTEVKFTFDSDRLWTTRIPSIKLRDYWSFIEVATGPKLSDFIEPKRPYFKSKNGDTVKIEITLIEGPASLGINDLGWYLRLDRKPGPILLKLQAGNIAKVIELPVLDAGLQSNSIDDLIASHGLGDHDDKHYVSWPDSETHDGIFYSPSPAESVSVNHWRWFTHPHLVVVLNGSIITAIHSNLEEMRASPGTTLYIDKELKKESPFRNSSPFEFRVIERENNSVLISINFSFYTKNYDISIKDAKVESVFWIPIDKIKCSKWGCPLYISPGSAK